MDQKHFLKLLTTSLFLWFSVSFGYGQQWKKIRTVETEERITSASTDNTHIYIGTSKGQLIRYLKNGDEDLYFSEINTAPLTSIDAWNRFKLFLFYRDQQSVSILNRFSSDPTSIDLRNISNQMIWLFTPGVDNSFWALNTSLSQLVKFDSQNMSVLMETPLTSIGSFHQAIQIRAFKNLVVLVDEEEGLFIFDQFASFLGRIDVKGISNIQILNEKIHTTNGDEYLIINPFSMKVETRRKIEGNPNRILRIDQNLISIHERFFDIHQLTDSIH